ncbi:MAG: nucleotide exchange factor GrpE [Candidatus Margulisiibacteriota bacterium]
MKHHKTEDLIKDQKPADNEAENYDSEKKELKKEDKKLVHEKDEISELEAKIKDLEAVILAEKDVRLRACAEMENFKKRKEQEKDDFCKYANTNLVKDILPILDSFDYAIDHAKAADKHEDELIKGFLLIQKQLHDFLNKLGVEKIEAQNQVFDPNFHQAIMQEENKELEPNTVIREMQKGYKFSDRIIRPSLVVVAK